MNGIGDLRCPGLAYPAAARTRRLLRRDFVAGSGAVSRVEQILLSAALAMLLVSVGLGAGAAHLSHGALRAHVRAGSVGWMTPAVLAAARSTPCSQTENSTLKCHRWCSMTISGTLKLFGQGDCTQAIQFCPHHSAGERPLELSC